MLRAGLRSAGLLQQQGLQGLALWASSPLLAGFATKRQAEPDDYSMGACVCCMCVHACVYVCMRVCAYVPCGLGHRAPLAHTPTTKPPGGAQRRAATPCTNKQPQ